jgi:hypothetical protein
MIEKGILASLKPVLANIFSVPLVAINKYPASNVSMQMKSAWLL